MKIYYNLALIFFVFCFSYFGCGTPEEGKNPIPILNSMSPASRASHLDSFILTVNGSNFIPGSKIIFNTNEKLTTYISTSQISCEISSNEVEVNSKVILESNNSNKIENKDYSVLVRNPAPGGGDSGIVNFTITNDHIFIEEINLSNSSTDSGNALLAVLSPENLFAAWIETESFAGEYLMGCRSTDGGLTWTDPYKIYETINNGTLSYDLTQNNSGNLYIVFFEAENDDSPIYFSSSTNSGESWTSPQVISTPMRYPLPKIRVDQNGNINVVFKKGNDIQFIRSVDAGLNWSEETRIINSAYWINDVTINNSDEVYFIWNTRGYNGTIMYINASYLTYSVNGVQEWIKSGNIPIISKGNDAVSLIIDSQNHIYITYGNLGDLYLARSTNNGQNWNSLANMTNVGRPDWNNIYDSAANMDSMGNINIIYGLAGQLYFRRTIDNGSTISEVFSLMEHTSYDMDLKVDNTGNIFALWKYVHIDLENVSFNGEIYFSTSIQ